MARQRKLNWTLILIVAVCVIVAILVAETLFKMKLEPFVYDGSVDKRKRFVQWLEPAAKEVGRKYGIPWQAMVVQMGLETGWGKSSLLTKYNNFGGIKAVSGEKSVKLKTREETKNGKSYYIYSKFAVFPDPYSGLEGYAKFIHRNKRYATALQYPNDPYQYIVELKQAGYATAGSYVSTLHGLLDSIYPNLR